MRISAHTACHSACFQLTDGEGGGPGGKKETRRDQGVDVLTVKLPDTDLVFVWEVVLERVAYWPLVVWAHDGLDGRGVCEPYGMAKLMHRHCEKVHAVGI